eukprot:g9914.t1
MFSEELLELEDTVHIFPPGYTVNRHALLPGKPLHVLQESREINTGRSAAVRLAVRVRAGWRVGGFEAGKGKTCGPAARRARKVESVVYVSFCMDSGPRNRYLMCFEFSLEV